MSPEDVAVAGTEPQPETVGAGPEAVGVGLGVQEVPEPELEASDVKSEAQAAGGYERRRPAQFGECEMRRPVGSGGKR